MPFTIFIFFSLSRSLFLGLKAQTMSARGEQKQKKTNSIPFRLELETSLRLRYCEIKWKTEPVNIFSWSELRDGSHCVV